MNSCKKKEGPLEQNRAGDLVSYFSSPLFNLTETPNVAVG